MDGFTKINAVLLKTEKYKIKQNKLNKIYL